MLKSIHNGQSNDSYPSPLVIRTIYVSRIIWQSRLSFPLLEAEGVNFCKNYPLPQLIRI